MKGIFQGNIPVSLSDVSLGRGDPLPTRPGSLLAGCMELQVSSRKVNAWGFLMPPGGIRSEGVRAWLMEPLQP